MIGSASAHTSTPEATASDAVTSTAPPAVSSSEPQAGHRSSATAVPSVQPPPFSGAPAVPLPDAASLAARLVSLGSGATFRALSNAPAARSSDHLPRPEAVAASSPKPAQPSVAPPPVSGGVPPKSEAAVTVPTPPVARPEVAEGKVGAVTGDPPAGQYHVPIAPFLTFAPCADPVALRLIFRQHFAREGFLVGVHIPSGDIGHVVLRCCWWWGDEPFRDMRLKLQPWQPPQPKRRKITPSSACGFAVRLKKCADDLWRYDPTFAGEDLFHNHAPDKSIPPGSFFPKAAMPSLMLERLHAMVRHFVLPRIAHKVCALEKFGWSLADVQQLFTRARGVARAGVNRNSEEPQRRLYEAQHITGHTSERGVLREVEEIVDALEAGRVEEVYGSAEDAPAWCGCSPAAAARQVNRGGGAAAGAPSVEGGDSLRSGHPDSASPCGGGEGTQVPYWNHRMTSPLAPLHALNHAAPNSIKITLLVRSAMWQVDGKGMPVVRPASRARPPRAAKGGAAAGLLRASTAASVAPPPAPRPLMSTIATQTGPILCFCGGLSALKPLRRGRGRPRSDEQVHGSAIDIDKGVEGPREVP